MVDKSAIHQCSDTVPEDASITREVTNLPTTRRSEGFVEVYANYVSFATSARDMTIMFGRTVGDDPDYPRIEQRAAVALSPQTAKAMAHILLQHLQQYEQQYGDIRITPIQP